MAEQQAFDAQAFLAKVGTGRTIVAYPEQHSVLTQGEAAAGVFDLQDGQVNYK